MAENRVIGLQNRLPWRLPADLRRFKELTMGHTLIMGRRTFESIGTPLPGRRTVLLTRNPDYHVDDVEIASSIREAFARVGDAETAFVAGGAHVYEQALPHIDLMFFTLVHEVIHGDVRFPHVPFGEWSVVESEWHAADARNPLPHTFRTFRRRSNA